MNMVSGTLQGHKQYQAWQEVPNYHSGVSCLICAGAGRSVARAETVLSLLEAQAAGQPNTAEQNSGPIATADGGGIASLTEAAPAANGSGGPSEAEAGSSGANSAPAAAVPEDGVRWSALQPNPAAAAIDLLQQSLKEAAVAPS